MAAKTFTLAEIAKHTKADDLWLLIHDKVYDVSNWAEHPGGNEVLIVAAGKDCTNEFEDQGHSDDARDMLKKYYIGDLDKSSVPAAAAPAAASAPSAPSAASTATTTAAAPPVQGKPASSGGSLLTVVLPLVLALVAIALLFVRGFL